MEGSGGEGGGKWGRRGREVGGKEEGTGNGVPPVHPLICVLLIYSCFSGISVMAIHDRHQVLCCRQFSYVGGHLTGKL